MAHGELERNVKGHCAQLQSLRPEFQLFTILEESEASSPRSVEDDRSRKAICALIDLAERQGVKFRPELLSSAITCLALGPALAPIAFEAWAAAAVEAALQSRGSLNMVYSRFGDWLELAGPHVEASFLAALPGLTPALTSLGNDGLKELLNAAAAIPSADIRGSYWDAVSHYGRAETEIVLGLSSIATHAIGFQEWRLFDQMIESLSPAKLRSSPSGRRLIPAWAKLSSESSERGQEIWSKVHRLILALDSPNSAARHVAASNLPRILARMDCNLIADYIEACRRLVDAFGIGVVHFVQHELPRLYQRHQSGNIAKFAEAAASTAEQYGRTAGWLFLDQRTDASQLYFAP